MVDDAVPPGYAFIRVLGAGGFGEVVLARHLALHREVAVKRIHAVALADADSVERFRREARLLASLSCPSVVHVYDLVVGPHGAHLVMEHVPGQPLSDLVARGPLPAAEALPVLRDVADALATAAEHGIVHRDIKPHNVFVLPDGRAKLGDFGLARAVSDPDVFRTSAGATLGTPAYFPPELGQGQGEPDERSDAYSFAVVAYETLTGRRPYEGTDAIALITAHWRLDPPDPRTVLPGLPRNAAEALLAGLAKDPARRLLPSALVRHLEAVPTDAWPAVVRRPAVMSAGQRGAPTVRVPTRTGGDVSPVPARTPGAWRSRRSRPRVLVAGLCGAAVLAAAVAWGSGREGSTPGLSVTSVQLSTEPDPATVDCPRAEVQLVAVFGTNGGGGTFSIRWTGPDGEVLAARDLTAVAGQRRVESRLVLTLTGRRPLRGPATVTLVEGDLAAKRPVVYRCQQR